MTSLYLKSVLEDSETVCEIKFKWLVVLCEARVTMERPYKALSTLFYKRTQLLTSRVHLIIYKCKSPWLLLYGKEHKYRLEKVN